MFYKMLKIHLSQNVKTELIGFPPGCFICMYVYCTYVYGTMNVFGWGRIDGRTDLYTCCSLSSKSPPTIEIFCSRMSPKNIYLFCFNKLYNILAFYSSFFAKFFPFNCLFREDTQRKIGVFKVNGNRLP